MVRNRKRKTDYGLHSEKDMAEAIMMVESGVSLRKWRESSKSSKCKACQTDVYKFPKDILKKFNIC